MTTTDLDELRRLAMAATPGPWTSKGYGFRCEERGIGFCHGFQDDSSDESVNSGCHNAAFIAAANPATVLALLERCERAERALTKISDIRDSIVGMQGFSFSEHAYPLVAALGEAGFKGKGYEISRANLGTLIEQTKAAEAERDQLRADLFAARQALIKEGMERDETLRQLATAQSDLAEARRERDEARAIVRTLQDDVLHRDEKLALVEQNQPVRAFFTLANVMRECREINEKLATAQAALSEVLAAVDRVADALGHDIRLVEQHRDARTSGGQQVGVGGPLASANPSVLSYLKRVVRDIEYAADIRAGAHRGGNRG